MSNAAYYKRLATWFVCYSLFILCIATGIWIVAGPMAVLCTVNGVVSWPLTLGIYVSMCVLVAFMGASDGR